LWHHCVNAVASSSLERLPLEFPAEFLGKGEEEGKINEKWEEGKVLKDLGGGFGDRKKRSDERRKQSCKSICAPQVCTVEILKLQSVKL